MRRRSAASAFLIAIASLWIGRGAPAQAQSKPSIDYQKVADSAEWSWAERAWGPVTSVGKYTLQLTLSPENELVFAILDGRREMFSWRGNQYSVYQVVDDRLYYIDSRFTQPGGTVVAVNLSNGRELWRSPLRELSGSLPPRMNLTQFRLDVQPPVMLIYGLETGGRYLEIKDVMTGETVGHKIYPPATTQPQR